MASTSSEPTATSTAACRRRSFPTPRRTESGARSAVHERSGLTGLSAPSGALTAPTLPVDPPAHTGGRRCPMRNAKVAHSARVRQLEGIPTPLAVEPGPAPGSGRCWRRALRWGTVTRRLALASLCSREPMGQQVFERELNRRAQAALGQGGTVDRVEVRSLRSPLPGTVRVPSHLLIDASPGLRRAAGRFIYRGHDVVHRLDLRLPPAPHPEVLTVHDVVPWRFPDEGKPPSDAAVTARRAAVVICPSQFSAEEVASQFGVVEPVTIPNGVDRAFFDATPLTEEGLTALGIRSPFILH